MFKGHVIMAFARSCHYITKITTTNMAVVELSSRYLFYNYWWSSITSRNSINRVLLLCALIGVARS